MKRMALDYLPNRPLCKFYARGYCARGASCFYTHSQAGCEALPPASYHNESSQFEPLIPVQCPNYAQGFCPKGASCSLQHITLPSNKVPSLNFIYIGYRYPKACLNGFWIRNWKDLVIIIAIPRRRSGSTTN